MFPKLTLVIGGAASGKSAFAENFAQKAGKSLIYLATAQALDREMQSRIDRHIDRRGPDWTTIEAPTDTDSALAELTEDEICLLDCATLWLSNQMIAKANLQDAADLLMQAIRACAAPIVIVTNEVGQGIVPENAIARMFREEHGRLNIALAAEADLVVQITAGLPTVLKGTMP